MRRHQQTIRIDTESDSSSRLTAVRLSPLAPGDGDLQVQLAPQPTLILGPFIPVQEILILLPAPVEQVHVRPIFQGRLGRGSRSGLGDGPLSGGETFLHEPPEGCHSGPRADHDDRDLGGRRESESRPTDMNGDEVFLIPEMTFPRPGDLVSRRIGVNDGRRRIGLTSLIGHHGCLFPLLRHFDVHDKVGPYTVDEPGPPTVMLRRLGFILEDDGGDMDRIRVKFGGRRDRVEPRL